jgi:hypothetical protein
LLKYLPLQEFGGVQQMFLQFTFLLLAGEAVEVLQVLPAVPQVLLVTLHVVEEVDRLLSVGYLLLGMSL